MSKRFDNVFVREFGRLALVGAIVATLLGAAAVRLDSSRTATQSLQAQVEGKLELLRSRRPSKESSIEDLRARIDEWEAVIERPSVRIRAIADAARSAEVELVSFREEFRPVLAADGVERRSHGVELAGEARHLATFLSSLDEAPGLVGIEDLVIERAPEGSLEPLVATLRVIWFAPGVLPDAVASAAGAVAGGGR